MECRALDANTRESKLAKKSSLGDGKWKRGCCPLSLRRPNYKACMYIYIYIYIHTHTHTHTRVMPTTTLSFSMNWPSRLLHCFDAISRESAGLAWLAVSAFLYSTMGIFLQRAAVALPSTQLVFIRSVFQGTLVVLTMMMIVVEEPEKDDEDDTCRSSSSGSNNPKQNEQKEQENNHTNEPQATPLAQSTQSQSPVAKVEPSPSNPP